MTREQIIRSSEKIVELIKDSKIADIGAGHRRESNEYVQYLYAIGKIYTHIGRFDENDLIILEKFGLIDLRDPEYWDNTSALLESLDSTPFAFFYQISNTIQSTIEILKRDYETIDELKDLNTSSEIIRIILPEEKELSKPKRLIEILESIELLYDTICKVHGIKNSELGVVGIDSGSDKSLDFLGVAKAMELLRDTLFKIFDRVRFYKEEKQDKRLDLIAKSLPLLAEINSLKRTHAISPEEAEIYKRNVMEGTKGFISAGAILPEFKEATRVEPRALMQPEQKLLAAPIEVEELDETGDQGENTNSQPSLESQDIDLSSLSKAEKRALMELFRKMQGGKEEKKE